MKKYLLTLSTLVVLTANPSAGFSGDLFSYDLLQALKDGDSKIRRSAAKDLGKMGPKAKEAVTALITLLKAENSDVRYLAAYALGRIGPEAREAVPALIALLKDEYSDVQYLAVYALGWIGPEVKEVVPTLIDLLKDKSQLFRTHVAYALGNIGNIGPMAKDDIIKHLNIFLKENEKLDAEIKQEVQQLLEEIKKIETQKVESSPPTSFVHPVLQGVDRELTPTSPSKQNTSGSACLYGKNC